MAFTGLEERNNYLHAPRAPAAQGQVRVKGVARYTREVRYPYTDHGRQGA